MVVTFNKWVGEKIGPAVDADIEMTESFYTEFQVYHINEMNPLVKFVLKTSSKEVLARAPSYFESTWTLEEAYTIRCTLLRNKNVETNGGTKQAEF